MEHRWGKRSLVDIPVTLHLGSGTAVNARMTNVSLSGALLQTEVRVPVFSQALVELELCDPRPHTEFVPGYVVREAVDGVGLEWNEFSPSVIENLTRGGAARLAADVEPNLQHNSRLRFSFAGDPFERRHWR